MSEKTVLYPFHIVAQCSNSAMGSYTADFRRYQDTPEMSVEGINDFYAWFRKERPNTKCVITGIFPLSTVTEMPDITPAKVEKSHIQMLRELMGYVENGSSETIKISQDDATGSFLLSCVNGTKTIWSEYGDSLEDVIHKSYFLHVPPEGE